jgi:hypothetical protein
VIVEPRIGADGDRSLAYLLARLGRIEGRVRLVVERREEREPPAGDRFRGLYISEADVERLLDGDAPVWRDAEAVRPRDDDPIEAWLQRQAEPGDDIRLRRLSRDFGLDPLDTEILLIALAPDLDTRFERLFGFLQDDITRRRASVGLAIELCGFPTWTMAARSRFAPEAPLVAAGLLEVEESSRPLLSRPLHVPDRVVAHLLGSDVADPGVAALRLAPAATDLPAASVIRDALGRGGGLVYLADRTGAAGRAAAAAAFARLGIPHLSLELGRATATSDLEAVARLAVREARLQGGGLAVGPVDVLATSAPRAIGTLADASCPVLLIGRVAWEPGWSSRVPFVADAPVPTADERRRIWGIALDAADGPDDPTLADRLTPFRLTPEQVLRATSSALIRSRATGEPLSLPHLQAGARGENAAGLERLARRVEATSRLGDLVLPPDTLTQLQELASRARFRDMVIDDWGMGVGGSRGRGVTGLFAGDPGTGKTMSAEVVAAELGLDLYVIDLSTVVDKYIGETEKNLDRIFDAADGINGVLLFDEADALFGKRSEVKDARDRYANVEIAYLLQRMERFDGLALLTTNLRANLDEAFARRLDAVVDFPMPEEADRQRLWEIHLPPALPRANDLDLVFLAGRFRISGGNIRNICVAAAYFAAVERRPVTMADLVRGTEREYRKLGRMTVEEEFGRYMEVIRPSNGAHRASTAGA